MTLAPGPFDLTTLAAAKAAARLTTAGDDDLIQRFVTTLSRTFINKCNRQSFYGRTVTTALTATKVGYLILPEYPVTSVSALSSAGSSIPAAVAPTPGAPQQPSGYLLTPSWDGVPPGSAQQITAYGYGFGGGPGGVPITYRAGYEVIGEAATVPASGAYTVAPAAVYGAAMVDSGVTLAGVAMVKVASAPAAGQYSFTQDVATGLWGYTFNAAQAGAAVLISYSFSPWDVFGAVAEWVAERYKYRDRMSETTRSINGQQTAGFKIDDMPDFVAMVANQYTAVGPLF